MSLQGLIVVAIAALAAAFLAWRVVGPLVRGAASPGCYGCSTPCELKTIANRKPCDHAATPVALRVMRPADPDQPL